MSWCLLRCLSPSSPRHRTHGHSPGLVPVGRGCVAPGARGALLLTLDSPIPVIKVATFPAEFTESNVSLHISDIVILMSDRKNEFIDDADLRAVKK